MIILDSINKSLEIFLGGAVTTSQLPIVAAYVDVTTTTYTPGGNDTVTNNATAVTAIAAPVASTQRQVKLLTLYNADTVAQTITIRLNNSGTFRILLQIILSVGSTLVYTDGEGFTVITSSGARLGLGVTGATGLTGPQGLFGAIGPPGIDAEEAEFPYLIPGPAGSGGGVTPTYGSWTPVIGGSGGQSGQTYNIQVGRYAKVDKLIHIQCYVGLTAKGTITGNIQIQGLPFTALNVSNAYSFLALQWFSLATTWVNIGAEPTPNSTAVTLYGAVVAAVSLGALGTADIANNTQFILGGTYLAD